MLKRFLVISLLGVITLINAYQALSDTLVLQPGPEGKDCYVCDCLPAVNNPNGPITNLYQGQYGACFDRMLIQWNLSALPQNVTVTNAIMELKAVSIYGTKSGTMVYYQITDDWAETGVTFATLPKYTNIDSVETVWPTANQWHSVDITKFVQHWLADTSSNKGIYGHCVRTRGQYVAEFSSSDAAKNNRPKLTITYTTTSDVKQSNNTQPTQFNLRQNYPNPFNPTTTIDFAIPHTTFVSVQIFDIMGKEVDQLVSEIEEPGNYSIAFDGSRLANGVYFYRLQAENFTDIKKCVLIK
jgi:hypothetical protein